MPQRKLTLTIDEQVYEGLYRVVGPRKISNFIEDLVRPHISYPDLERAYADMAQNRVRESAALDWAENTASDAALVRRQIYLKPRQDVQIKRLAAERSTTEADIIREAIDMLLSEIARQRRAQKAWDETLAFMEERYAQGAVSEGRTWTRDELYEERLSRYGKRSD